MTIKVLSDTALVIDVVETPGPSALRKVRSLARKLSQIAGLDYQEIVPGLTAVALHLRPDGALAATMKRLESALSEGTDDDTGSVEERERVIPVAYGADNGPDLQRVADHAGITVEDVIRRHIEGEYQVMALGFSPGFPYLSGLDPILACPRLDSPRLRVPAGAVGIGGSQTGVYPSELPGGWNLIGRTHQRLFDPEATDPSWLQVGDRVRFTRMSDSEIGRVESAADRADPAPSPPPQAGFIEVSEGGLQTTVQDLGRPGYQAIGVAEGGALNPRALTLANLLVGNPAGAPALEWGLKGPVLHFYTGALVAITGAGVIGRPLGRPFWVKPGEEVDLSSLTCSGRGYLAVSGGIRVPLKLGSASTHLGAGFGGIFGRALRAGDRLPVVPSSVREISVGWGLASSFHRPLFDSVTTIRVLPGPDFFRFGSATWASFLSGEYRISPDSNRMGLRLQGPAVTPVEQVEMVSQPVALGTVQIPPRGQPVVLMADRQSVGGYPRLAGVISADISALAQVPLGGCIRFEEVSIEEAEAARRQSQRDLGLLAAGLRGRISNQS